MVDTRFPENTDEEIIAAADSAKSKLEPNYIIIKFRFYEIIVPHSQGIKILDALSVAEFIEDIEWSYQKIVPIHSKEDFVVSSRIISRELYIEMKMRHLLNITKKPEEIPF